MLDVFSSAPPERASFDSQLVASLNKLDFHGAQKALVALIKEATGVRSSWSSPQYATSRAIQSSIKLDHNRNGLLTFFALDTLRDRYFLRGSDGTVCETAQDFFARVATGVACADKTEQEVAALPIEEFEEVSTYAQKLYDVLSQLHALFATPILTNAGTNRGNLISCFLNESDDNIIDIFSTYEENAVLAQGGGGIGTYWGRLRSQGAKLSRGGKSSGPLPFLKVFDSATLAVHQAGARRGAAAAYIDVSHPDIEDFIDMRRPEGAEERRCQNVHHGISLSDAFMQAVKDRLPWDLVDPQHNNVVRTVDAYGLWKRIVMTRVMTGEPYMLFIDTVNRTQPQAYKDKNLQVKTSNLCVAPETMVLTRRGYEQIATLADRTVEVWNGIEWSETVVRQTGEGVDLIKVSLSNGVEIDCTPQHKFAVVDGLGYGSSGYSMVEAQALRPGVRLAKFKMPVMEGTPLGVLTDADAYTHGFFCGDGTIGSSGQPLVYLYGEKKTLVPHLSIHSMSGREDASGRLYATLTKSMPPKFWVPTNDTLPVRLRWFAGLLDSDGTVARNGDNESLQVSSVNLSFLREVRLMLTAMGVDSKVTMMKQAGTAMLPDGHGGIAEFPTQTIYRLLVSSYDTWHLQSLGLKTNRLVLSGAKPKRDARQFVSVVSVEDHGRVDDTYCFTEPKKNLGTFNGVVTGQCIEITLPTMPGSAEKGGRTAVCCLGSINYAKYEEWKNYGPELHYLMVRGLDNVLEHFIRHAGPGYEKAVQAAKNGRDIGLGAMGWFDYLQQRCIPFESIEARAHNRMRFKEFGLWSDNASLQLAKERGAAPDGGPYRNVNRQAIAPTATIGIIAGASPSIEPPAGNVYRQETLSGKYIVRNPALEALLAAKYASHNNEHTWQSVTETGGSVQHLDWMEEDDRKAFKTAYEINQREIVQQAADRQPYVSQSQSLNLFFAPGSSGTLSASYLHEVHFMAWELGVKSLYYCRSESVIKAANTSAHAKVQQIMDTIAEQECTVCQ